MTDIKEGVIKWKRFDKDDKTSYPPYAKEIMLMVLKSGQPRLITSASFGLGGDFYEVITKKPIKGVSGGNLIVNRKVLHAEDYDDIAWVLLDVPEWWTPVENSKGN